MMGIMQGCRVPCAMVGHFLIMRGGSFRHDRSLGSLNGFGVQVFKKYEPYQEFCSGFQRGGIA